MADQIPPISGAPADAPWYRWAEGRIVALEREIERFSLDVNAASQGIGASVESLSQQLRDLQGRVSYGVEGWQVGSWTSTQADDFAYGESLTITLAEDRLVNLSFAVSVDIGVSISTTASSATAFIYAGVMVNGAVIPTLLSSGVSASVSGGAGRATSQGATSAGLAQARSLVALPAGTHTLRGCLQTRRVNLTGSAAGVVSVSGHQLFADVLQPTGA